MVADGNGTVSGICSLTSSTLLIGADSPLILFGPDIRELATRAMVRDHGGLGFAEVRAGGGRPLIVRDHDSPRLAEVRAGGGRPLIVRDHDSPRLAEVRAGGGRPLIVRDH